MDFLASYVKNFLEVLVTYKQFPSFLRYFTFFPTILIQEILEVNVTTIVHLAIVALLMLWCVLNKINM